MADGDESQEHPQEELPPEEEFNDDADQPSASALLYGYLQSDKGHEIATQVINLIQDVKKSTLDRNAEQSKLEAEQAKLNAELIHKFRRNLLTSQSIVFTVVISATVILTYIGKFDPSIAVLFGTLVGYFFGRRASS